MVALTNSYTVVGVASLAPTNNSNCMLVSSNSATLQTFSIPVSTNSSVTNLEIVASSCPSISSNHLPACWSLDGVLTTNTYVGITNPGVYTVTCTAGTSAMTNIIWVIAPGGDVEQCCSTNGPDLLGYWNFDNSSPWVGNNGQQPLADYELRNPASPWGHALQIDTDTSANLSYPYMQSNGIPNINCINGAISFWFKPDWSVGPNLSNLIGPEAQFIELGDPSSSGWWSLFVDPSSASLIFETKSNSYSTINLSCPITNWSSNDWYQVVLDYSTNETSLYINGVLAQTGPGMTNYPAITNRMAYGFSIGSDHNGQSQIRGTIDEVYTFDCPLSAQEVATGCTQYGGYPGTNDESSAPSILTQPLSQTNYDGSVATFSVTAIGGQPLSYQWSFNNNNISGATNTSFVISDVQSNNAGNYVVVVTNMFGSVTSVVATLTNVPSAPTFVYEPISQTVVEGDTVTFSARAVGTEPITYQWQEYDGSGLNNLSGQTNSKWVDINMENGDAGTYAVVVSNSVGTNIFTNAVLTDATSSWFIHDDSVMPVFGPRQDYTFQAYNTYYIGSNGFTMCTNFEFYGTTRIEGGAVIKFDNNFYYLGGGLNEATVATLVLHGPLVCDTGPYDPAILTSVDDDSQGELPWVDWYRGNVSSRYPVTATNGYAYLNLNDAHDTNGTSINYLRFCYADQAVTTPTNSGVLDVWNCQFLECNSALNSRLTNGGSTNRIHNALFSRCNCVFSAQTNLAELDGEQVKADVWSFWSPVLAPGKICLTNSIVMAEFGSGPVLIDQNVTINPDASPFEEGDDAFYYLAPGSGCRGTGTTNISAPLLQQLRQKTTAAPISLSALTGIDEMTFFPVAKRYGGGPPDLGYYYDPLDYTVASISVTNGVTILPGTAIGFRNDYVAGFFLQDGSALVARGMPTNPIVFADIQFVQEGPLAPGCAWAMSSPYGAWWYQYGGINFICPQAGTNSGSTAPSLDMKFCNIYATHDDFLLWAGDLEGMIGCPFFEAECGICYSPAPGNSVTYSSAVDWTMEDCDLFGGVINLGQPWDDFSTSNAVNNVYPSGSVLWKNNVFQQADIWLYPSYLNDDGSGNDGITNLDLSFAAYNNLFRGGWLCMAPIPTSAGDWIFNNNLFDHFFIDQIIGQEVSADYNGFCSCWYTYICEDGDTHSPAPSHDQFLTNPPPYQNGPFGNYYMATNTILAHAGCTNANLLGLYYYTTQTNQVLEEDSFADIGPGYVAAQNVAGVWRPLLTNGIPDYLADVNGNGQIPSGATSTGSAYYTNIDLDGDGMVGSVETALGTSPLVFDNPLRLIQKVTGQEPSIVTFVVSNTVIKSVGQLVLMVDGIAATTNLSSQTDGNGNPELIWNTTNYTPGQNHYLQAHLILTNSVANYGVTADGLLIAFNLPAVSVQPASQTNGLGGTATFTSTTTGPGPYTYQWQFDGTNIAGATNSTYTITNLATTNGGSYTVVVTNAEGDPFTSTNAVLIVSNINVGITMQPMSQAAYEPDTVTFAVTAVGTNLSYQWQEIDSDPGSPTYNTFVPITNATGSNYTLFHIQSGDAGTYAVLVSSGTNSTNSILSSSAILTDYGWVDYAYLPLSGPRQNYTFAGGTTYLICSPTPQGSAVDLYGSTTIEGGAVIKFDFGTPIAVGAYQNVPGSANTGLIVHGSLNCQTGPYRPATLTSVDDDSQGELLWVSDGGGIAIPQLSSTGNPVTVAPGTVYLNLDDAHSANPISITNLRFFYADQAVTTPTNSGVLQVWDSQFYGCNSGVNSRLPTGCSTNQLHNVLFAACDFAVAAQNSCVEVDAEQVTADVFSFCDPEFPPSRLCMTNCIVVGAIGEGPVISTQHVANPPAWPFQSANDGNYYLPPGSQYRSNGTTNISPGMLVDLAHKTTYAPITFPTNMTISGQLTLFPQAARYTGGAPDLGYYYDPLDYTIADMVVQGGTITVLRGTAIGFRNDYICGFILEDNSLFTSQGTPTQPITFTDNTLVQEGAFAPGQVYNQYYIPLLSPNGLTFYGGPAFFVPAPYQSDTQDAAPQLNMRFCNFYMTPGDFGVAAGYSAPDRWGDQFPFSSASSVVWNMQDCGVYGGQIVLGKAPNSTGNPPGSVSWINNLLEETLILLEPGFDRGSAPYVDLPFQAYNNLFKGGVLALDSITTSQGNWQFQNNLFDMEDFSQNTSEGQTLDYDYNGWWTNSGSFNLLCQGSIAGQLTPTQTGDGSNDQILTNPPPYQSGPFGNYYMAQNTVLTNHGSTTADQLGLYHYTTATNQAAQSNSIVDIGLHYLAASYSSNGWVPLDTDGDGIPDYVEDSLGNGATGSDAIALGETDWLKSMTDGVNYDPSNAVYLDIDLSGDGLVGRVKAALGMSPFDVSNPLVLTQVITGQEPDIATFELPISYVLLTNIGSVNLQMNSLGVTLDACQPATNGHCLLVWDTTYDPPYLHYLQPQLTIYKGTSDTAIVSGTGPIFHFYSSNVLQFFLSDSMYSDTIAYLDAQLPCSNANYTITLYDPTTTPPSLIRTITNSTTTGIIQED